MAPLAGALCCSNPFCKRTSPGDGPTCRWHVRNYGSEDEPQNMTLCNACKINFDQGKYCPFCVQIYREKDPDSFDGKQWIGCETRNCRRWVHVDCEVAAGNIVKPGEFYCPSCRENCGPVSKRLGRHAAADRIPGGSPSPEHTDKEDEGQTERDMVEQEGEPIDKVAIMDEEVNMTPKSPTVGSPKRRRETSPSPMKRPYKALRVDLSKLQTSSLRRYKRVHNLQHVPSSCKEELKMAVARHFAALVVSEEEVIRAFTTTLMKQHQSHGQCNQGPAMNQMRPLRSIAK